MLILTYFIKYKIHKVSFKEHNGFMSDVFTALSKYSKSKIVNPEENFFTEAFAYILRKNKKLCKVLFQSLLEKLQLNKNDIIIRTQVSYSNAIIDLIIKDKLNLIFCEIKLKSTINEYDISSEKGKKEIINQIEKYQRILDDENEFKNKYLILISYDDLVKEGQNSNKLFKIYWKQIYQFIEKFSNNKQNNLIKDFLNFMWEKAMGNFNGFNKDYFISLGFDEEELIIKELFTLKKYFEEFTHELESHLNQKDNSNWQSHIYSYDKVNKNLYNHFFFKKNNRLNLNINTSIHNNSLWINIWLPLWGTSYDKQKEEIGKVNQTELSERFNKYKNNISKISNIFYNLFKQLDITFSISLGVKQYEHIKGSNKSAQAMQKGHSTSILTIQNGTDLIFGRKDKSLLLDSTRRMEIYDNINNLTKFLYIDKKILNLFFVVLFQQNVNQNNPLINLNKKFISIYKELPIEYVVQRKKKIIDDVGIIILEFKKILDFINLEL